MITPVRGKRHRQRRDTRPARATTARLRFAVFANELCDLFQRCERDEVRNGIHELLARFEPSFSLEPEYCRKLVNACIDKLKQFAPIFQINISSSRYCRLVQSSLDEQQNPDDERAKSNRRSVAG